MSCVTNSPFSKFVHASEEMQQASLALVELSGGCSHFVIKEFAKLIASLPAPWEDEDNGDNLDQIYAEARRLASTVSPRSDSLHLFEDDSQTPEVPESQAKLNNTTDSVAHVDVMDAQSTQLSSSSSELIGDDATAHSEADHSVATNEEGKKASAVDATVCPSGDAGKSATEEAFAANGIKPKDFTSSWPPSRRSSPAPPSRPTSPAPTSGLPLSQGPTAAPATAPASSPSHLTTAPGSGSDAGTGGISNNSNPGSGSHLDPVSTSTPASAPSTEPRRPPRTRRPRPLQHEATIARDHQHLLKNGYNEYNAAKRKFRSSPRFPVDRGGETTVGFWEQHVPVVEALNASAHRAWLSEQERESSGPSTSSTSDPQPPATAEESQTSSVRPLRRERAYENVLEADQRRVSPNRPSARPSSRSSSPPSSPKRARDEDDDDLAQKDKAKKVRTEHPTDGKLLEVEESDTAIAAPVTSTSTAEVTVAKEAEGDAGPEVKADSPVSNDTPETVDAKEEPNAKQEAVPEASSSTTGASKSEQEEAPKLRRSPRNKRSRDDIEAQDKGKEPEKPEERIIKRRRSSASN